MYGLKLFPFLLAVVFLLSCQKEAALPLKDMPYFTATIDDKPYKIEVERVDSSYQTNFNINDFIFGAERPYIPNPKQYLIGSKIYTPQYEGIAVYFITYVDTSQVTYKPIASDPVDPTRKFSPPYFKDKQLFQKWLSVGFHPYQYDFYSTYKTGVAILFFDKENTVWSTAKDLGIRTQQFGPFFNLTPVPTYEGYTFRVVSAAKSSYVTSAENRPMYKLKVKFDCTLYNEKGKSMHIRNGELVGYFEDIFTLRE